MQNMERKKKDEIFENYRPMLPKLCPCLAGSQDANHWITRENKMTTCQTLQQLNNSLEIKEIMFMKEEEIWLLCAPFVIFFFVMWMFYRYLLHNITLITCWTLGQSMHSITAADELQTENLSTASALQTVNISLSIPARSTGIIMWRVMWYLSMTRALYEW